MDDTYTILQIDQAQNFTYYLNTVDEDINWMLSAQTSKQVKNAVNIYFRGSYSCDYNGSRL